MKFPWLSCFLSEAFFSPHVLQVFEFEAEILLEFDGKSSLQMKLVLLSLYGWLRVAFLVVIVDCTGVECRGGALVVSGTLLKM